MPVLHLVTTDAVLAAPDFPARARAAMRAVGLRGALHLRGRALPPAARLALARALAPDAAATGCRLVVNDRLDVALAAHAWGVQLGERSLAVRDARAAVRASGRAGDAPRLGASVHDAAAAAAAARAGADWLLAGHLFATPSHPGEPGRGVDWLAALVAAVHAATGADAPPVLAIGGVEPRHVAALRRAGAYGVAVVRGVWAASDAGAAASDYLTAHDHAGDHRHADAAAQRGDS